ncbi:DNA repair protein XRCC4 [Willisornis vidua]|uniref:DNA repair protein XRCC4 n=1 Tax=Willisornis vidua TaxID=1566151 RepID=A0ABQ9DL23_9PASS|nr:DNA repair protein XRCC4 [Willisornis vidua]
MHSFGHPHSGINWFHLLNWDTLEVSEAEISMEAADMEMDKEKYVGELKKALVAGEESSGRYNFVITRDQENRVCHFSYERKLKDGSERAFQPKLAIEVPKVKEYKSSNLLYQYFFIFVHTEYKPILDTSRSWMKRNNAIHILFRLGSVKLSEVPSPAEAVKELIGYCLDSLGKLQARNEHLQRENERLFSNWHDTEERLEKCVEAKEELEADLYHRFVLVLNEKKAKIRSLQKLLSEAKEPAADAKSSRGSMATTQMAIKREDDYVATTEMESESLTQALLPSGVLAVMEQFIGMIYDLLFDSSFCFIA